MFKNKYIKRKVINRKIKEKGFNIYPFVYEEFIRGKIDTPFQKSIYLRELIVAGRTLRGKKVIENLKPPKIRVMDIMQDLRFNIGYALASMHSYRNGDKFTASYEFFKSCLFATRNLEILKLKKFPLSYDDIYKFSKKLNLEEYGSLVSTAYKLRKGKVKFKEEDIFKNISYLNKFIETQVIKYFKKHGNKVLLK